MSGATISTTNYGPLKLPLVKKSFESIFPKCEYEKYISEEYSPPGLYIICGTREYPKSSQTNKKNSIVKIAFLTSKNDHVQVVKIDSNKLFNKDVQKFSKVQKFRKEISLALKIDDDSLHDETGENLKNPVPWGKRPRWQIYSKDGLHRYHDINLLISGSIENPSGTSLLFTGGVFFWPGVKIGYERLINDVEGFGEKEGKQLYLKTLSIRPLIFEIHDFIAMEECDHLIEKSRTHIKSSVVKNMDKDIGKADTLWRTSKTYFMPKGSTETLKTLERRVRDITRIPLSHGESAQILRYTKTGHYYTHHDYFDPANYQKSKSTLNMVENGAKNRLSTVFWYMSDVKSGGETNFPRFNGAASPADTKSCLQGLSVKPKKGKVIIFHNMHPNGDQDPLSLHAGCSVGEGDKWSANKWIWNKPFNLNTWNGDDIDINKEKQIDLHLSNGEMYTDETHQQIDNGVSSSSSFFGTILSDGNMMMLNNQKHRFDSQYNILLVIFIVGICMCWRFLYHGKIGMTKNKKDKL